MPPKKPFERLPPRKPSDILRFGARKQSIDARTFVYRAQNKNTIVRFRLRRMPDGTKAFVPIVEKKNAPISPAVFDDMASEIGWEPTGIMYQGVMTYQKKKPKT